jgi:hypothetical protein
VWPVCGNGWFDGDRVSVAERPEHQEQPAPLQEQQQPAPEAAPPKPHVVILPPEPRAREDGTFGIPERYWRRLNG